MKQILYVFILSILCTNSYSQLVQILDRENNQTLEMVYLLCKNPEAFAITNSKGIADLKNFKGSKKIEIRCLGYKRIDMSYDEIINQNLLIYLDASKISIDDIVISGSKWNQEEKDVVSKITSIKTSEISLQNPQTAADLLNVSGKVYIQKSQQGGGSPMIRGFATNRLLYVIDGVRMNTAIFRSGNIQNVISLDPFAIERTEIMFGPGSSIYGSDAVGGIMSFQTLSPQLSLDEKPYIKGRASTRYSSANSEKTYHFDVNIGFKKWALLSSFSSNDFGHLRMGANGPDEYLRPFYVQRIDSVDVQIRNEDPLIQNPTAYTQINLMQKIKYLASENLSFEYGLHYSTTSNYSRYDRHIRYRKGMARYAEWDYGPQKWMMNLFTIHYNESNILFDEVSFKIASQNFIESRINRDINDPIRYTRSEEVNALSLNIDLKKILNEKNRIFYGLEYVNNDVLSTGLDENINTNIITNGPSRYPNSSWNTNAVYLSYHSDITRKLHFQSSLRYSQFNIDARFDTTFYKFPFNNVEITNSAITGSAGLKYRVNANNIFYTNIATGFRAPNIDDIGKVFDSAPGAVTVPNPNLSAEYVYNYELGFVKIIDEQLKIDAAFYYTFLENSMVRRAFKFNGLDSIIYDGEMSKVEAIQNAANTIVYGIQIGADWKFSKYWSLSSDLNYQKGEEELDNGIVSPSRHAAPLFGNTKLMFKTKDISIQLNSIYNAEVSFNKMPEEEKSKPEIYAIDNNGNPYSPSWYTINFKCQYQLNNQFNISAGLENITDQRYRPYSSGIVAPGRNFIMSLEAKF